MAQYSGMWTLSQVSQAVKNQTWTGLPPSVVEYLIVAGGGSGGIGGGGAGGLLAGYAAITPGSSYFVTVGGGGATGLGVLGTNGATSVFDSTTSAAATGRIVASGGGAGAVGGSGGTAPSSGGSGGGGNYGSGASPAYNFGATGISGQGNAGNWGSKNDPHFAGGGGGGAGTIGSGSSNSTTSSYALFGGEGGAGIASAITGNVTTYAGGGGGAGYRNATTGTVILAGAGGVGGGGAGGKGNSNASVNVVATAGSPNTGGGGGGRMYYVDTYAANGGSGVVIIRYPGTTQFFVGGVLSYANGYMIHTFYSNGTLTPTAPTVYSNPDYQISNSLRFRASASAYLNRTPATATNQKTWTWSGWVKRGTLGATQNLATVANTGSSLYFYLRFLSTDVLEVFTYNSAGSVFVWQLQTTQVFRDPSAWYHIVVSTDTTQSTSSDRVKIYVNGSQITSFAVASYPTLNYDTVYNYNGASYVTSYLGAANFYDGELAELNSVDGQALTPASFGYVNPTTGVWAPAKFREAYGTNGFYLKFADNSNITATTLGVDSSGNGNNWTPNNLSITAGSTYDSLTDVPTLNSTTVANYAVLNPLQKHDAGYTVALTNGNLSVAITYVSGVNMITVPSTVKTPASGKWYWEITAKSTLAGGATGVGVITPDSYIESTTPPTDNYLYIQNGNKFTNGTGTAYGSSYTNGDVIGVALDVGAGTITFYKNNTSQGTAFTGLAATTYYAVVTLNDTGSYAANFGQQPFVYTPPSGFLPLNTFNLSAPTIINPATVMAATTYAGTGGTKQVSNAVNTASFKPDLVWIKSRSAGSSHQWADSIRGVTKYLFSDVTNAEETRTDQVTAFSDSGFSLSTLITNTAVNNTDSTYVAWQWKAGGTAVSNTAGTITSSVSANTTAGFSVVTYTGTGANATVGHGLGVAPGMIIVKNRSSGVDGWPIYHVGLTSATFFIKLNSTDAQASAASIWNSTAPTLSVFSVGTSTGTNQSANTYVAYCWAPVAGYSAFGSYTGNGSTDGPFVYTGFRPRWIMAKASVGGTENWYVYDTARDTYNYASLGLLPNLSNAETNYGQIDILSNGFKMRGTGSSWNASAVTYIYAAFAENPLKYALAR